MKMTDLRAKARAIFGSAIAEPMPKQPNGAAALQKRANARPIPTYKVGGVVKKQAGGAPLPSGATGAILRKKYMEAIEGSDRVKRKDGRAVSKPGTVQGPDISVKGSESRVKSTKPVNVPPRPSSGSPEADDVLITTPRGRQMEAELRRREAAKKKAEEEKRARADRLLGIPAQKDGGKAGMKKGGKAKDGLAVMIAIGKPMKGEKKSRKGMMDGGTIPTDMAASKLAAGGAGKIRKGQAPIKRAAGGAGKVRKGEMKGC